MPEVTNGQLANIDIGSWIKNRIIPEQITKYLDADKPDGFIDDDYIEQLIGTAKQPDKKVLDDILAKSLAVESLSAEETAVLLAVDDEDMLAQMAETATKVKKKVYDNRIVTFAPLYLSNYCVNNCQYCGFRTSNTKEKRLQLTLEQVKKETEVLAGKIGHKRLIVVYGEHPYCDTDYIVDTLKAIYSVEVKTKNGTGAIRRCNVNAAPMSIEDLKKVKDAGIGTFQVFQETYNKKRYAQLHPKNTIKGNYLWRLYCMHRAFEAGIDDVGIGSLFGLGDWKFEVLGLVSHAIELEKKFGIGPHTVSFPRIEPADNTPLSNDTGYKVSDADFKKLILVLRLAIPYTGMILTARENPQIRREMLPIGCTQTDASSKIGIGAYSEQITGQQGDKQQFFLGDTRSLDEVIRELAKDGYITSFCTAGYRCGRTGKKIMDLLRTGTEGKFCKLNAVITFREWLDDFASQETKQIGEKLIVEEIAQIKENTPQHYQQLIEYYEQTKQGCRDLYF